MNVVLTLVIATVSAVYAAEQCDLTKLQPLLTNPAVMSCSDQTKYSFVPPTRPTDEQLPAICKSAACRQVLTAVAALGLPDCDIGTVSVKTDLIERVTNGCAALTGNNATTTNTTAPTIKTPHPTTPNITTPNATTPVPTTTNTTTTPVPTTTNVTATPTPVPTKKKNATKTTAPPTVGSDSSDSSEPPTPLPSSGSSSDHTIESNSRQTEPDTPSPKPKTLAPKTKPVQTNSASTYGVTSVVSVLSVVAAMVW